MVRKLLPRIVLTAAAAAAVVAGVMAAGAWFRDSQRERHSFAVQEIDCQPPAGQTRQAFLDEVHYYGQLPARLNTLDADLPDRLKAAFAKHPRVERVNDVTVVPPNRVRVDVVYRQRN